MKFSRVVLSVLLSACVLLGSACGSSNSGGSYTCESSGITCQKTGGTIEACCTSTQCKYTVGSQDFMCNGTDCSSEAQTVVSYCGSH